MSEIKRDMADLSQISKEARRSSEFFEGAVVENVVFGDHKRQDGSFEYRSSSPDRKIIVLAENSAPPDLFVPYKVKIIQDTNPGNPKKGKFIAELIFDEPITISEEGDYISYLGVRLEKAENTGSIHVPRKENFSDYINDSFSLELQRKIATAFAMGEPILIEGGTSIGKTTTVKKMCADLGYEVHYCNLNGATDVEDLMGRYVPNPFKVDKSKISDKQYEKIVQSWAKYTMGMDPSLVESMEYIFAEGKVTSGLRQEEGKKKVIVLDEYGAAAPNILIRLHEVLDALERNGEVVLAEDASEMIKVSKKNTMVIALTNPPGKGFFAREPLDPAQLRRWVYQKEVTDLPKETFGHSVDAMFGLVPKTATDVKYTLTPLRETAISAEQLAEIPGIEEILVKYKEFHGAAKELVRNRVIAADQPQVFTFDDRVDMRRVRDYILNFYQDDINVVMQSALRYFYLGKLESAEDRAKLSELIRNVYAEVAPRISKRKGLETEDPAESKKEKKERKIEVGTRVKISEEATRFEKHRGDIGRVAGLPHSSAGSYTIEFPEKGCEHEFKRDDFQIIDEEEATGPASEPETKPEKRVPKTPEEIAFAKKADELRERMKKIKRETGGASPDTITATTPEGKEKIMDLSDILQISKDKFIEYNLPEFAAALPEEVALSESALALCREAIEQGFTEAVYVPDLETQDKVGIDRLKRELADKPLPKGAFTDEEDNYPKKSVLEDLIATEHFFTVQAEAKRQDGYLLFYSPGPIPEETKNMYYPDVEVYFKEKNWDGLTLPDYYILQRIEAEINHDHTFDVYDNDPKKSRSTWLIASRALGDCMNAGWDQNDHQLRVIGRGSTMRFRDLGARPAIVVPLLYSEARPPAETKEKSADRDPGEFLTAVFERLKKDYHPDAWKKWSWSITDAGVVDMKFPIENIDSAFLDAKVPDMRMGERISEGYGIDNLLKSLKGKKIQSVDYGGNWFLKIVE